ncbi:hypothetical protein HBDW_46060 [Herbaspirillum sp. DW155]|uniref:hypothetical protein n=1 Tax=Herbaspirillum sp. DW155 TaxID=3095609 RepID=UPI0030855A1A|nr:hypothetical protein HBDW_46060 [Herbaspirillum sp. DW155]
MQLDKWQRDTLLTRNEKLSFSWKSSAVPCLVYSFKKESLILGMPFQKNRGAEKRRNESLSFLMTTPL